MKKILNWGWYGFENYGDDLLQNTMFEKFKEEDIDVVFPMQTEYPGLETEQVRRNYKVLFSEAANCDALIIGPGGLFPFSNLPKLMIFYVVVLYWKLRRRKVVFFGIGVSKRINGISRLLWRKIASHSDAFFTRSEGFLDAIGVKESDTIQTMADVVFASSVTESYDNATKKIDKMSAIVVANLFKKEDVGSYQKSVEVWSEVCDALVSDGFMVDLIAFTKGKDDMMINDIIKSTKLSKNIRGGVRQIHYNEVSDAVANWNQYDLAICMRFHSLVLSVLANVPVLPIAYGHKTVSLAEKCGLGDYLLYWNPAEKQYFGDLILIDSQRIIEKFHAIRENRDQILSDMEEIKKEFVDSAKSAMNLMMDHIR